MDGGDSLLEDIVLEIAGYHFFEGSYLYSGRVNYPHESLHDIELFTIAGHTGVVINNGQRLSYQTIEQR